MKNERLVWLKLNLFLRRFIQLDEAEFKSWEPFFQIRKFGRRELIIQQGQREDFVNIVAHGMVRKYITTKKGEVTVQIAPEDHLIHAEISFHNRQPSKVLIETIEPSELISITYDNLHELYHKYPKAETLGRLFVTQMLIIKDRRYIDILKKDTREIFIDYVKSHPEMMQRVPQKYIASYLNIKPETFSRLKHLLLEKAI